MLPPSTTLPPTSAERWGDQASVDEVRAFWLGIMRGNERGMSDSRMRMRASELLARHMGMLVDLSLSATATAAANGPDVRSMTVEERAAETAKLEAFMARLLPQQESAPESAAVTPNPNTSTPLPSP
jgi:hypothetical protein